MTAVDRILSRCVRVGHCLVWQGGASKGYGQIWVDGRLLYVHRVIYEHFRGPIPRGLTIDHVRARGCRFTKCCNDAHMEPVTRGENSLRGNSPHAINARKTHCDHGHALGGDNVEAWFARRGRRNCLACHRRRARESARRRASS